MSKDPVFFWVLAPASRRAFVVDTTAPQEGALRLWKVNDIPSATDQEYLSDEDIERLATQVVAEPPLSDDELRQIIDRINRKT